MDVVVSSYGMTLPAAGITLSSIAALDGRGFPATSDPVRLACNLHLGPSFAAWEAGALDWRVHRSHGRNWQAAFSAKLEEELHCEPYLSA